MSHVAQVIIVRGGDGEIRIFYNACRYRGGTACRHARGNAPKLVCFYYNWSYERELRAVAAGARHEAGR
jgi:stachydrine N-demethylase